MTDQPTLHARLLAEIEEPASVWLPHQNALRAVVEEHKPELFGGIWACLACSPGMPPPILIEAPCPTVRTIARELGIPAEEDHRG